MSETSQQVESAVEIEAPATLAYAVWSDVANFPRFMRGVQEVRRLDERHLHWRAEMWGAEIEWEAEIVEDIPNERISWRTITGDRVSGTVSFMPVAAQRVRVTHTLQLQEAPDLDMKEIRARIAQDLQAFAELVASRAGR